MNIYFYISIIFIGLGEAFAQNYTTDFKRLMDNPNQTTQAQLLAFEKKYKIQFEKNPDNSVQFYSLLASSYFNEGNDELTHSNYINAFNYARQATDTQLVYLCELNLAQFYRSRNYLSEAEKMYNACMYGLSVIYGQSSRAYTQIFYEYTCLQVELENYSAAQPNVEALLFYYKTLDGENNLKYLSLLNYKAIILQNLGKYEEAISIYKSIVEEERAIKLKDPEAHITSYLNLGDAYREMGRYEDAIFNLKTAQRLHHNYGLKEDLTVATICNNLALSYKALSDLKNAEQQYNQAQRIYTVLNKTNTEPFCSVLSNKADLFRELGRYTEAVGLLQTALSIRAERFGTKTENYANATTNLAMVLLDAGDYKNALDLFLKARSIYAETIGEQHQGYANILNALSITYLYLNDYKNAEENKARALEIIERSVGKNHFRYASYLISSCGLYTRTKNYLKAETNLKEALVLVEKNFGKTHELYALSQFKLAEVYFFMNRYEEASPYYTESLNYYSQQLNAYFDAMSEENQASFLAFITPVIESYNNFVMHYQLKQPKANLTAHLLTVLRYQLQLKALLTNQSAQLRQQVNTSNDNELKTLFQNWILAKNELINNYKSTQPAFDDAALMKTISDIEAKLKLKLNTFNRKNLITFKAYQQDLAKDEALVEIFKVNELVNDTLIHAKYGVLLTLANATSPQLIIYQNGNYLDSSGFERYYQHIEQQLKDSISYTSFFQPIMSQLKGIRRIYFSPSGVFCKVNPLNFYNAQSKRYVGEDIEIRTVLSTAYYKPEKEPKTLLENTASLFGYPDFDFDLKNGLAAGGADNVASRYGLTHLSKLPGTKLEVEEAKQTLEKNKWLVHLFTNEKASEQNLRRVVSPKILHIATHGYFLSDVKTDDKLFLGFENSRLKYNPNLRSGLLLAGVGPATNDSLNTNSENDGVLTAKEAELLNLSNTHLVVLSACQTGLGAEMGSEGVAGLQRAFTIAGARYIIMSLWPVDDNATQLLMTEFYKNFSEGNNLEMAFQMAQTVVKKTHPHPYYWSAFVVLKTINP